MRRITLLLLLLAGCQGGTPPPTDRHIVILHTNDLHGRVRKGTGTPGLEAVAAHIRSAKREAQAAGARVLLIDCGDFFQGTPEGDYTEGRVMVEVMNDLGYDALALGNHDFDFGPKVTEALARLAKFPFLSANIHLAGGRGPPPWIRPSMILEDLNIEIVGLITGDMTRVTTRRAREGLDFELEESALDRYAWKEGVTRLLATHSGQKKDVILAENPRNRLTAILGGHSHQVIEDVVKRNGRQVTILQSGCHGQQVGRMEIVLRDGAVVSVTAENRKVDPDGRDPAVAAIIARHTGDIDKAMDEVVGELVQAMPVGTRDRVESSPLGNHLTDLMREASGADVALHNRTGIRAPLPKGRVRLRDLYLVSPFGNTVTSMTLSGKDLAEILELSLSEGTRFLLEISGGEIEFDPAAPKGKKLRSATIAGKPLDPAASYRVATNSFLAQGGDFFSAFTRGTDPQDSGRSMLDLHREALRKARPLTYAVPNRIRSR